MTDTIKIRLPKQESTVIAGMSLAQSLYTSPTIVLLSGDLGAGKTTLIQSLAKGLGIEQPVTSPTYALEQRYTLDEHNAIQATELVHIDLYRLTTKQADHMIHMIDMENAIVCIEWPERLSELPKNSIHIQLEDLKEEGRDLTINFSDINIPTEADIVKWREEVMLPNNVIEHCEAVAKYCEKISTILLDRFIVHRPFAVNTAAKLHDLLRFVDFKESAAPAGVKNSEEQKERWTLYKEKYRNIGHECAAQKYIQEKGFYNIANIVQSHGPRYAPQERDTIEQKIVFYADKRLIGDKFVTIEERYQDFANRYANGTLNKEQEQWLEDAKQAGEELGIEEYDHRL